MKTTKQKLSICIFAAIFLSTFFITSCENRVIIPEYSTLNLFINGEEKDAQNIVKINVDEIKEDSIISIIGTHYNLDDSINKDSFFTFECEGLSITKSKNSASFLISDFPTIRTYIIKAKSSSKSNFDKAVIIELTSNINDLNITYSLKSELPQSIAVNESEKSGTLDKEHNSVVLLSNALYSISATSTSGEKIKNLIFDEKNALVDFRNTKTDLFEMFVNGTDKAKGTITITSSFYKLSYTIFFTIKDVSSISIKENTSSNEKKDEPILTLDKDEKNYDILLNSLSTSDVLEFSLDAENIEQEKYYDGSIKSYKPEINKKASWYRASSILYSYNDESFFKVSFNGSLKSFSITPIKNTIFAVNGNEENLHSYIYIKYESDREYRWKYRVLIGGKLERINLAIKNGNTEEPLDPLSEISVDENTSQGWIFKANFIPENASSKECLWYLAKVNTLESYEDENKNIFKAPLPLREESQGIKSIILNYNDSYTLGDKTNGLKVYTYSLSHKNSLDEDTIFVNYTPTSEDIALVCINIKTKLFTYVNIKNRIKNTVTIKGSRLYGSYDVSSTVYDTLKLKDSIKVKDENGEKSIATSYSNNETLQVFPNTIDEKNSSIRCFLLPLNSTLTLEINSSIKLTTIAFSTDEVGNNVLHNPLINIDALDEKCARITIQSAYNYALQEGKKPNFKNYLTDENGAIVKLNLNGSIPIILRIIVHN